MRDFSLTLVYLVFLALPGIVGSRVWRQLTVRRVQKEWEDFVEILLFALGSYLALWFLYGALNVLPVSNLQIRMLDTLRRIQEPDVNLPWGEIAVSSVLGVTLAYIAAVFANYKLINKFGRKIRATKRYGDEDVWEFLHNSLRRSYWALVRDHKLDVVYFGQIKAFSDSGKERELLLTDVEVFGGEPLQSLYSSDVLYVSRDQFDLTIEIPEYTPSPLAERAESEPK